MEARFTFSLNGAAVALAREISHRIYLGIYTKKSLGDSEGLILPTYLGL